MIITMLAPRQEPPFAAGPGLAPEEAYAFDVAGYLQIPAVLTSGEISTLQREVQV